MSDVPVTAWWLAVAVGSGRRAARRRRRRRGGGGADAAESRAAGGRDDGGGPDPCVPLHRTPGAALRAAGAFALPLAAAVGFLLWLNARLVRVALHVGLWRGIGVVRARQRRGQRRPLRAVAPRDADARRAHRHRGPVRPPRGAARRNGRGVTDPGLVRACRRCRRRGVLPAGTRRSRSGGTCAFSFRPFRSCSILTTPVLVRLRGGGASRSARAAARRRRGASRVGTTSSRRASAACSIFSVSRADTWRRARSPRSNCRRTPSC